MIESAEKWLALRYHDDLECQHRAAHESLPDAIWFDIIQRYPDACVWVVHNKTVPVRVLEKLIDHPDWRVRSAVARKRKLTPDQFHRLAQDSDSGVRYAVASNAKTPRVVLESLVTDPWDTIAQKAKERLEGRT